MIGKIALDSSVVIAFIKGEDGVKQNIDNSEQVFLPIPVAGELIYGALKSKRVEYNLMQNLSFINKTILVPCDFIVAEQYAKIRVHLYTRGTPIPENDIWIAACCLVKDVPLATRDVHFEKITDLKIEKW
ncbi:MAG: type II toxin-antitoxin system VapC family toxin [bacterium]